MPETVSHEAGQVVARRLVELLLDRHALGQAAVQLAFADDIHRQIAGDGDILIDAFGDHLVQEAIAMFGGIGAARQGKGATVAGMGAAGERPQEIAIQVGDAHQGGLAGQIGGGDGVAILIHFHGQDVGEQQGGAGGVRADGAGADEHHIIAGARGDFAPVDAR